MIHRLVIQVLQELKKLELEHHLCYTSRIPIAPCPRAQTDLRGLPAPISNQERIEGDMRSW